LQPWVKEIETWINNRFFTLRDAFRSFDIEKQGEITESKFLEGIIQMNLPHITEDVIRAVFKALDQNHDGRISFEEFCYLNQRRRLNNNNSPAPPQG
jgi:Ca2+-binding EF-hand superfamily protein